MRPGFFARFNACICFYGYVAATIVESLTTGGCEAAGECRTALGCR
jgi:hypothetical protein